MVYAFTFSIPRSTNMYSLVQHLAEQGYKLKWHKDIGLYIVR